MLASVSNQLADIVADVSNSVVQVHGRRRPASGVVYADGVVVTTASVLGRGDSFTVRQGDGTSLEAELRGWDPATSLAVLKYWAGGGAASAQATLRLESATWPWPSPDRGRTP